MNLYMEFYGGLGDVILRLYFSGYAWYRSLETMSNLDRAMVAMLSYNPDAHELFKWHPRRKDIGIINFILPTPSNLWEDPEWRVTHGLPEAVVCPPFEPAKTLRFYPAPEDRPLLESLGQKKFLVMGAHSASPDRSVPQEIQQDCARMALRQGYEILMVGNPADYQHGSLQSAEFAMDGIIDASKLSVPGLCEAIKLAAGSICAHSAVLHMAWSERKPVFLLYSKLIKDAMLPSNGVGYMQGADRKNTDHMEFSEYKPERFLKWLDARSQPEVEEQEGTAMNSLMVALALTQIVNPFEADAKKAETRLAAAPDDPASNLIIGKRHLFAGEIDKAVPFLLKGSDASLKAAAKAQAETDLKNALVTLETGDLWTQAMSKNKPIRQACLDQASGWYAKAWPDLSDFYKMKLRERLVKLYAPMVPSKGGALPEKWGGPVDVRHKSEVVGTISHSGSSALRMTPFTKSGNGSMLRSPSVVYRQGTVEFSAWILSDGTDSSDDGLLLHFNDENKKWLGAKVMPIKADLPVWTKVGGEVTVPPNTAFMNVEVVLASLKGYVLIDDIQLKIDGKLVIDQGFEGK